MNQGNHGDAVGGETTRRVLSAAVQVHRTLGPGLLESTYRSCLVRQFQLDGLASEHEVPIPIHYGGMEVACAYRADIIVEGSVLVELKAVERLQPIHVAQVLTYLKLSRLRLGLLINFNVTRLQLGIRRLVR